MYKKFGFTLFEILIGVGIMAVIIAITLSGLKTFNSKNILTKDTELVVSVLDRARNQAVSGKNGSVFGVHVAPTAITLFEGSSYSAGSASNIVYDISKESSLSSSLVGGVSDIVFSRITGKTTQTGTITLTSVKTPSDTKTVTISVSGLVDSN